MRFLYEKCVDNKHFGTDQFGKCPITSKQTMGEVRRYINKLKNKKCNLFLDRSITKFNFE